MTCAAGLEKLLAHELGALGFAHTRPIHAGVHVYKLSPSAIAPALLRINYTSRLATRVLLPLLRFPCRDRKELYERVYAHSWLSMFASDKSAKVEKTQEERKTKGGKGDKKVQKGEEEDIELPTVAVSTVMNLTSPGFDHSAFPSQVS